MCGIGGIVLKRPDSELPEGLASMEAALRHRGPDDAGRWVTPDGRVGLLACRLAIRDLSPAGHMPMAIDDGLWITYNGELYNTHELRLALQRLGHVFRSDGDTEVILRGYMQWGPEIVQRLRGMFAFAVLDTRIPASPLLMLARDRLGIKPLYYYHGGSSFVFASELRGLRASGCVPGAVDPVSIGSFLQTGSVPGPETIYAGVRSLPPSCTLTLNVDLLTLDGPSEYWRMPPEPLPGIGRGDMTDQIGALLRDAVKTQMVSDAPIGAFLSGGLDSCAVAALMQSESSRPIRTCSMSFVERAYSEAATARGVARHIGAEHYERLVEPGEMRREMDHLFRAMDQPTVDGVNTYFVSKTAREAGLTVALSGLGGDELFGGYSNTFGRVPLVLRGLRLSRSMPPMGRLTEQVTGRGGSGSRFPRLLDALSRPPTPLSAYQACRGLFAPSEVRRLVHSDIWTEMHERAAFRSEDLGESQDLFTWISRAELSHYTRYQLLRDTDVMSMAHSLEVRVPLLDHRLTEYMLRLPQRLKASPDRPKALLRHALARQLPDFAPPSGPKRGFTFPLSPWMRGPLRADVEAVLDLAGETDCLRPAEVQHIWDEFLAGRLHWSRPWSLVALLGWWQMGRG